MWPLVINNQSMANPTEMFNLRIFFFYKKRPLEYGKAYIKIHSHEVNIQSQWNFCFTAIFSLNLKYLEIYKYFKVFEEAKYLFAQHLSPSNTESLTAPQSTKGHRVFPSSQVCHHVIMKSWSFIMNNMLSCHHVVMSSYHHHLW